MLDRLQQHLHERELKLQLLMEYGSQAFNLHTKDSDVDYLAVVSQNYDNYLGLNDYNRTWKNYVEDNVTVQFMGLKRFFQLAQLSNFTLFVGLQNVRFQNNDLQHLPNFAEFSCRRLAHHCLGLVDNNSQRQYMKAYSSLFVMFLMQNGHLPNSLDYRFLLENTKDVPVDVKALLEMKRSGVKYAMVEVKAPYHHDDVNVLPDANLNYNEQWLAWLKESMA